MVGTQGVRFSLFFEQLKLPTSNIPAVIKGVRLRPLVFWKKRKIVTLRNFPYFEPEQNSWICSGIILVLRDQEPPQNLLFWEAATLAALVVVSKVRQIGDLLESIVLSNRPIDSLANVQDSSSLKHLCVELN